MTIRIEVTGAEHSGKTTLIAFLGKIFEEYDIDDIVLQSADPQFNDKLLLGFDELAYRLQKEHIVITELQTAK